MRKVSSYVVSLTGKSWTRVRHCFGVAPVIVSELWKKQNRLLRKGMWTDISVAVRLDRSHETSFKQFPLMQYAVFKGFSQPEKSIQYFRTPLYPLHTHTSPSSFPVFRTNSVSRMWTVLGLVVWPSYGFIVSWIWPHKRIWHQLGRLKSLLVQLRKYLVSPGKNVGKKKKKTDVCSQLHFESCTVVSNASYDLNLWQKITHVVCIFCGNVCGSAWACPDSPVMAESCTAAGCLGPDKLWLPTVSQTLLTAERWRHLRNPKNRKEVSRWGSFKMSLTLSCRVTSGQGCIKHKAWLCDNATCKECNGTFDCTFVWNYTLQMQILHCTLSYLFLI